MDMGEPNPILVKTLYYRKNIRGKTTKNQRLPPTQPYPWLLYFNRNNNNQTFCSISDPTKTYSRTIPELGNDYLLTVQHGWCLFEDTNSMFDYTKLFLWNPSNLKKINLPNLLIDVFGTIDHCILSCSPTTATHRPCFIFLFPHPATIDSKLLFCQLGDKQWTQVDYNENLQRPADAEGHEFSDLVNPVYCRGRLYAESHFTGLLMVIEKLESRGFQVNSAHVYLPHPPNTFTRRSWLLESNNQLFHIQITFEVCVIISVDVHILDFSRMVWEKVKSIKDKVFFLSEDGLPFALQAINPETEGGRIYLTLKDNKLVYIYIIEDNRLMICHAFSNLPRHVCRSFWFRPDLRMTFSLQEEGEKTQTRGGESSAAVQTVDIATNSFAFPFEALPFDIIREVAKYLNVVDYLHFRATSRFFRSRAPSLQWRSLSQPSMSSFDDLSLSPLFVFFEKENVLSFVHPKHGVKYKYNINLPEDIQGDCEICYSKDGWLLLAVNTFSNMFFNPFSREVKQLAYGPEPAETARNTMGVGISHPPTSSECVVVELCKFLSNMRVNTTCLGMETWEDSGDEDSKFCLSKIKPCFHNGVFYYLSGQGKLGILEEAEQEEDKFWVWEECEKPDAPCTEYYKCFLVECNGSLLSVFEGDFGNWVQVFKLNESEMIWTRVESLEDHMLFAGDQSFSAVANISGMENKIYFPRFYDQNIVFYSLETKNYHTFESSKVVNFHCMSEQFNSSWIQPRWR